MSSKVPHCVYSALRETLLQYHGLDVDSSTIFHLLGGYTFEMKWMGNDQVPIHQILGSKIRYSRFEEGTGIMLRRVYEHDLDKAKRIIFQQLAEIGYLLVFTNCFYLPYDTMNYKRNSESHLVLIHSYDEEKHEFCVTDASSHKVQIHEDALWEACFKVYPRPDQFHQLHIEQRSIRSIEEINIAAREAMQSQAQSFVETHKLEEYKTLLKKLDHLDGIFRRFACEAFAKELRHPHGMVYTRQLLSESCESLSIELRDKYWQLGDLWNSFSIPLIRFSHRTVSLEALLEKYDEIMIQEISCSQQLLQILEHASA
jgi:hypothetical protein